MKGRKMDAKILAFIVGGIVAGGALVLTLFSLTAKRPVNLGVFEGRLAPCPDSPNCVCTQAADEVHRIEPLTYTGSAAEAMARLQSVLAARPRVRIVTQTENYLHAEFTSRLFRFVDDVEFLLDDEAKAIHFRSASRAGHSDLGVNRRRMEEIRQAFNAS
jgi:uncharacterized protein (DUF1499 family)